jgi:hypothetical protein
MDPVPARAAGPLPTTADLERVMGILGVPGDPVAIMKDHPDARRRAELLARVAAGIVHHLRLAEALADLDVDDRADMHWDADCAVAAPSRRPLDGVRLLDLQLARLAWVHHALVRGRGPRPHPVADTVATTIGAVTQLVEAWRDSGHGRLGEDPRPGRHTEQLDPRLADALLMVRDAAGHLAAVLRANRYAAAGRDRVEAPPQGRPSRRRADR